MDRQPLKAFKRDMENKSAFCNQSKNAKSCAEKQEEEKKKMRTNERGSAVDRVRAGGEVREVGCRRSGK